MRDLVREYLSYCRAEKGLAANSVESYASDLAKLTEWSTKNGLDVVKLTRLDLREWLIDLGGQALSENTRRRIVSSVRGFYKFLMFDGHIAADPTENLASPQKGAYLPKFLNVAEVERLLAEPDISTETGLRDRALLEIMYACGLRVSEAVGLRVRDVDLEAGILTTTGKGSKTRRVPVGSSAVEYLRSYLDGRNKKQGITVDNIFLTPAARPLTRQQIHRLIAAYAEKAGLEGVSPHTLRHSFATHLVQNSADIRSVQQMLGHADISTTQIYTHITDKQLRRSYDKFHPRARRD